LISKADELAEHAATAEAQRWFENTELSYQEFEQQYWRRQPWAAKGVFDNLLRNINKQLNSKALLTLASDEMIDTRIISREPAI
jgi:ribosomal protein L16 Arg81 hydroxylase